MRFLGCLTALILLSLAAYGLSTKWDSQNANVLFETYSPLVLPEARPNDLLTPSALPGVELSPGYSQSAQLGEIITFTHILTNTGDSTDTFILDVISVQGWPVELLGGAYPSGTARLPLPLDAGLTATLQVSLSVPQDTFLIDTTGTTIVTATSQIDSAIYVTATDTILVQSRTYTVLLPLVMQQKPPVAKLGVGFGFMTNDPELLEYDIPLVKEMGANWVRIDLPWIDIERSPGEYAWEPYDAVFERLAAVGLEPLPIIHSPPDWAAEVGCGPISDTLALENFLEITLERYKSYADAWEFINEPDGRAFLPDYGPSIGCWGPYPEEYARQLGIFYRKVKRIDPGALVVLGGLAYDNWIIFDRDFFDRTLQNGAGRFFDVANLHYYPINPEFPTIAHKVNEIHNTMVKNDVHQKRIWVTETGMWVNDIGVEGFEGSLELQRDFIVQELTRGFGAGVDNILWFEVRERPVEEGKVHRWLISMDHEPINGYSTFQHYAEKVQGMPFPTRYQNVPGDVEAYEFATPGRSLYILWSNSISQTVTIPSPSDAVLIDRDGDTSQVVPLQDGQVIFEVGTKPVFLEITHSHTALTPYNSEKSSPLR